MSPAELVGVLNEVFTRLRWARGAVRAGEGEDHRRCLHGGRRHAGASDDHTARVAAMALDLADASAGSRPRARLGIRSGSASTADRSWPASSVPEVHLRHLGRHGEPGQPDGVAGHPGRVQVTHAVMERLGGDVRVRGAGPDRRQGQGPEPDLVPRWPPGQCRSLTPRASRVRIGAGRSLCWRRWRLRRFTAVGDFLEVTGEFLVERRVPSTT